MSVNRKKGKPVNGNINAWKNNAKQTWKSEKSECVMLKKTGMIYDNVSKVKNVVTNFNINVHALFILMWHDESISSISHHTKLSTYTRSHIMMIYL
jgi:hypothetical protein